MRTTYLLAALFILTGSVILNAADEPASGEKVEYLPPVKAEGASPDAVPLKLDLPKPQHIGTPKKAPADSTIDLKTLGKRRGDFLVPPGVRLLSKDKKAKVSDPEPIAGDAAMITDGSREGTEGNWVEMGPGLQWSQVDLEKPAELWAIVVWFNHAEPRIYRDVVVQVSDDAEFKTGVTTLFNNDQDNSAGLGAGKDREYFESNEGKLVDAKGTKGRYVRIYTKGNTSDAQNHMTEIEAYGK